MANTYLPNTQRRVPAAGDNNWNDENDDNHTISDVMDRTHNSLNKTISGGLVTDGGGLDVDFTTWKGDVDGTRYDSVTGSSLTLTAGPVGGYVKNWIYVNDSGVVVDSTSTPTGEFAILAMVDTSDTDVLRIADLRDFGPSSLQFAVGTSVNEFSTDATFAGDSDDAVPTEKAVKEFVETNRREQRNIFINGAMQIAQRATSVTGKTGAGYYTVDRLRVVLGSAGTFGYSRSTDSPDGFGYSHKVDCEVSQGSLAAGAFHLIRQSFEGRDLQHLKKGTSGAESLTLQFWVKSNKTGTYIVEIRDNNNSRQISASYTIDSASTWEYKTITFAGDTTGGTLTNDNNSSLDVSWWLAAGSNFASGTLSTTWTATNNVDRAVGQVNLSDSASNDFWLTGVQLEPGEYDGPFEHLSNNDYEMACQRYYFKGTQVAAAANAYSTTKVANGFISFPVRMRAAPSTLTVTSVSLNSNLGTYSSVNSFGAQPNGMGPSFNVTGATAGYAGWATYTYTADAEIT